MFKFPFSPLAILAVLFFNVASFASSSSKLLQKYAAEVEEVDRHLAKTRTLVAKFSQASSDGSSEGEIYIDKHRQAVAIDYLTGNFKLKIFSVNGSNFYVDKESKEIFPMPSGNPVVEALLAESVSSGKFLFQKIIAKPAVIEFVMNLSKDPSEGTIRLVFQRVPDLQLVFIGVSGGSLEDNVSINLHSYVTNNPIKSSVFDKKMVDSPPAVEQ